jgi:hypothetical protein
MRLDSNNIRNIIYYIIIIEVVQYVRFFFAQKKVPNRQQSRRASQRPTGTLGFFFEPTTRVVESLPLYPEATMLRYVLPCNTKHLPIIFISAFPFPLFIVSYVLYLSVHTSLRLYSADPYPATQGGGGRGPEGSPIYPKTKNPKQRKHFGLMSQRLG